MPARSERRESSADTASSCPVRADLARSGLGPGWVTQPLASSGVANRKHLRAVLAQPGFRRLFATRLAGQFGDGVFQAALAGAVLFDPQRQAHADRWRAWNKLSESNAP